MNEELEEGKQLAIQLVEHMRNMGAGGLCIPVEVHEQGLMDGERVWVVIQTDTQRIKERTWVELGKNSGEIQSQRDTALAELAEAQSAVLRVKSEKGQLVEDCRNLQETARHAQAELAEMRKERDVQIAANKLAAIVTKDIKDRLTAAESERDALKERVRKAEDEAFESKRIARDRGDMISNVAEQRDRLQHIIDCADAPLMRDVLAERDRLRAAVENAPHGRLCRTLWYRYLDETESRECDCWKAALAVEGEKPPNPLP